MNKIFCYALLVGFLVLTCKNIAGQSLQSQLSLEQVILLARNQSPASKRAETLKQNRYWQYRMFRSNYNPQLALSGNLPGYNRDYFSNRLDDGTIVFQSREQINSGLNLGLIQPIAFTGGELSINTDLNYFNDLERDLQQYSSTLVNIRLDQPLFGFNDLKWDKRTAPLAYEESQREYVEEMEYISRQAVGYFFNYMDAQINLEIAQFNLNNNDTIYKIELGRFNIGTTSKDKLLQVELQLLRSQQDVAQAELDLQTSRQQLFAYTGLNPTDSLQLILPKSIPQFSISLNEALTYARMNRADYIAFERRRIEAERDVARAMSQRFQANITASYGLNDAASVLPETYEDPNNQQRFDIGLSVPILDWGRNEARQKTAMANQQLTEYTIAQDKQNFEQEIVTQVKQFEVLRKQIEIAKKSDEVARERYLVAQNRYLIGKLDITNLNIALTEKDNAARSYIRSLRDFWVAYFDLRRLTLYDFATNQLLYQSK